jgi:hypothetical protein
MKIVETPAQTKEMVDFITCDLCGKKIFTWAPNVDDVEISHKSGITDYGSHFDGTISSFDVCGSCYEDRVVAWFKSQGVEPAIIEVHW